jgi:predicted amidohydrolase
MMVRVGALQLSSASESREEQLERIMALLGAASDSGVRIACLPELALTSYFSLDFSRENECHFVGDNDPSVLEIAQECKRRSMSLILPVAEQVGPVPYNTALVIDENGSIIGRYRKAHLPGSFPKHPDPPISTYERLAFAPSPDGFPVFDLSGLRIGIQICYDINFPEGFRILALKGADVIFYPTNAFDFRSNPSKSSREKDDFLARARAYENTVFFVKVNKRGQEHGRTFTSPTRIIGPRGEILDTLESEDDGILVHDIDRESVIEARRRLPWGRDRRPEVYAGLV